MTIIPICAAIGIILSAVSVKNMFRQLQGHWPSAAGKVWTGALRCACGLAAGVTGAIMVCRVAPVGDDGLPMLAFVGCGVGAMISAVNFVTLFLNRATRYGSWERRTFR